MVAMVKIQALQTIGVFKDSISNQYGTGSGVDICGGRTYSITTLKTTAAQDLTVSSEISINPVTG